MSVSPDLMYRLLVQGVSEYAIYMLDGDGNIMNWNAGAERAKGYTAEEVVGRYYELFYSEADRSAGVPRQNLDIALRDGRVRLEGWRYRRDGSAFWASITIDAIYDASGTFLGFAKITRDLTEQHELLARIDHQANHDALTGLLNRAGLFKRLDDTSTSRRPTAVHYIDLDHFKPINDRLGHAAGDQVLREVAQRLTTFGESLGVIGRIGGDEFVVAQFDRDDTKRIRDLSARIIASLGAPITIDAEAVTIGASIGVARVPTRGSDIGTILRRADTALYDAKRNGRNRFAIHDSP